MPNLPNPWLAEVHPRSAEESATATTHSPRDAVAEPFDVSPLRDEPIPLFLTEPAPEMDRELEAILSVFIRSRRAFD